jgi:hypothetical protein
MIERPNYVRVTNGNKEKIRGRFNGEDYEFLPGKPNDIPMVVAAHIFDFGREDKLRALNRLGWLQSSDHLEKAMEKLNLISFTEAPPLIEAEMPELEDDPAGERLPASGSTAPPVSPEASGKGGGGSRPSLPKPARA